MTAQDGLANDHFGDAVAVDGNMVLVGAPLDDDDANARANQGAAYVFERSGGAWTETKKLTHSTPAAHDTFGEDVALVGDVAVVGAPQRKVGADDGEGSVYVFTRDGTTWSQEQLTASAAVAGAQFGYAVAFDDSRIAVGAPFDNTLVGPPIGQGAAFVFERIGSSWIEDQKVSPANGTSFDAFGYALGIHAETLAVGAFGEDFFGTLNQGSARVYVRGDSGWQMKHLLTQPGATGNEGYGRSVSVAGDTIAVGSPYTHVDTKDDQGVVCISQSSRVGWIAQKATHGLTDGEGLGAETAMEGGALIASAPGAVHPSLAPAGAIYVYEEIADNWIDQERFLGGGDPDYDYGSDVAISGSTVVVGEPDSGTSLYEYVGRVAIYQRPDTAWSYWGSLYPDKEANNQRFGYSVDIHGDTMVVGARAYGDAEPAYVFVRGASGWTQQQKLTGSGVFDTDGYGEAVGVHGNTIIVGTSAKDQVYLFERTGATWTEKPKLHPTGCAVDCGFGQALDIAEDIVAVGAPMDDDGGAVYVFVRSGAGWTQQARLTASDGLAGVYKFGASVAFSGDTLVVGTPYAGMAPEDTAQAAVNMENRGAGYVFVRTASGWTQQAKLADYSVDKNAHFGTSAAVFNDTVVFGAPNDSSTSSGEGSLYIHRRIRLAQSISFGTLPDKTIGDPPFKVSATASSGLPVSFSSKTKTVCTVAGKTVTLAAVGTCRIAASQPGDTTYAPAAVVVRSFTVAKASQSINFGALSDKTIGDPPFKVSATASSGLPVSFSSQTNAVCTVAGKTVTLAAVGTCRIAAFQAGDGASAPAAEVARSFAARREGGGSGHHLFLPAVRRK